MPLGEGERMGASAKVRRSGRLFVGGILLVSALLSRSILADEVWVAPTYQADLGGFGISSNSLWPVTAIGVVRLAWGVPNNLQAFQSAKVAIIPHAPGGAANLNIFICSAANADAVAGSCAGPFAHPFVCVANKLTEVDISADVAPRLGVPGATYVAVLAYTTPTTGTDHIVGMRFSYSSASAAAPSGMVAFFAGAACPSGWDEYTTARGRVIVGLPAGGASEGTLGTGLGNLAARTITDVPSHTHTIDPPATTTSGNGAHTHTLDVFPNGASGFTQPLSTRGESRNGVPSTNSAGGHAHTVDVGPFSSGSTGAAAVDVSMPYVQLIACRKS